MVNSTIGAIGLAGILACLEPAYAGSPAQIDQDYKAAVAAAEHLEYTKAASMFEQIIALGPADNKRFKDASNWLRKTLWENQIKAYNGIMRAEIAAARTLKGQAEAMSLDNPERLEMLQRAKSYLEHAQTLGDEVKKATSMMERR